MIGEEFGVDAGSMDAPVEPETAGEVIAARVGGLDVALDGLAHAARRLGAARFETALRHRDGRRIAALVTVRPF